MAARSRRVALSAMAATVAACAFSSCGGTASPKAAKATASERLVVVVGAYPLAQLAAYIGGGSVRVVDLAAGALPPQGLALTAQDRAEIAGAGLVLDVGDGYQPAVEQAAAQARHHLALLPAVSKAARPYEFWLDPTLMANAAAAIGKAMTGADPSGRMQFANGVRDFQSVAQSVGSDYVNSLSSCTRHQFMSADDAFGRLAWRYGLRDLSIEALGEKKAEALVGQDHLPAVFTEKGVSSGLLQVVASAAAVSVKTLDPMEETPLSGTPRLNSYFSVMEDNLQALEGPLACDSSVLFN